MVKVAIFSAALLLAGLFLGPASGQLAPQQQPPVQPRIFGGRYFPVSSSDPVPRPSVSGIQQRQPVVRPRVQTVVAPQQQQTPSSTQTTSTQPTTTQQQPISPLFPPQQFIPQPTTTPQQTSQQTPASQQEAIPSDPVSQNLVRLAERILALKPDAKAELGDFVAEDVVLVPPAPAFGLAVGLKEFAAHRRRWHALFDVQNERCQVLSVNPLRNSAVAQCGAAAIALRSQPELRVLDAGIGVLLHFDAEDKLDAVAMKDLSGGRFPELVRAVALPFRQNLAQAGFLSPHAHPHSDDDDDDDDDDHEGAPFGQKPSFRVIGYVLSSAGLTHGSMLGDE